MHCALTFSDFHLNLYYQIVFIVSKEQWCHRLYLAHCQTELWFQPKITCRFCSMPKKMKSAMTIMQITEMLKEYLNKFLATQFLVLSLNSHVNKKYLPKPNNPQYRWVCCALFVVDLNLQDIFHEEMAASKKQSLSSFFGLHHLHHCLWFLANALLLVIKNFCHLNWYQSKGLGTLTSGWLWLNGNIWTLKFLVLKKDLNLTPQML